MRTNTRDYPAVIMAKMRDWNNVAQNGIDAAGRARGKKNLRYLVNKYPELAKAAHVTASTS